MISAQDIFVMSMNLIDEESEDGTYNGYPDEYKKKAWSILTLLQAELTRANESPSPILNESSIVSLDDRTACTVLPYGLAAHLLMTEDQSRAAYFNARYDELKRKRPAVISKIKDVYAVASEGEPVTEDNVIDGGEF